MDLLYFSSLQKCHLSLWQSCEETSSQPRSGLMMGTESWKKGPEKPLWALAHPSLCPGAGPALPLPVPREASPAHPQGAPGSLELLFQYLPISTIKQLFLLSNLDLSLQFKAITVCLILWGSSEKEKKKSSFLLPIWRLLLTAPFLGLLLFAANNPHESFYSRIRNFSCSSVTPLIFSINSHLPWGTMQHSPDQEALEQKGYSNSLQKYPLTSFQVQDFCFPKLHGTVTARSDSLQFRDPLCWLFSFAEAEDVEPATFLPKHISQTTFPSCPTCFFGHSCILAVLLSLVSSRAI